MLMGLSSPILATKDFILSCSIPYFSMIRVDSHPNPFPRADGSAIIISISPTNRPSSGSWLRKRFVSPTIAGISSPQSSSFDLSKIMNVSSERQTFRINWSNIILLYSLSSSFLHVFCIAYSSSKDNGSLAVSFCSSSLFIHS